MWGSKMVAKVTQSFEELLYAKLHGKYNEIRKKAGMSGGAEVRGQPVHTGFLMSDLTLGGGVMPGGWYTFVGPEGSGKSTLAQTIMVVGGKTVPILHYDDYEGSSGSTDYLENIMKINGIKMSMDELFGVKDKKGNVKKPGRVNYDAPDVLEDFFNTKASLLRAMPDKIFLDGHWWYVFDDDKHGREMAAGKHDKQMKTKYSRLFLPALDGTMQALFLVDSLPAMNPASLDVDDAKAGMALRARLFSENIPKVKGKLRKKKVTILAVNQLREKPGVMYGDPTYEPGGKAPQFYSDARIRMTARSVRWGKGAYEEEDNINGGTDTYRWVHTRAHKNKMGVPNQEGWMRIWVSNNRGKAMGFDPVFDTYEYLTVTNQISGTRNKIKINHERLATKKPLTWNQLKMLVVGNVEQVTKVQRDSGMIGKKDKPFKIREVLRKQLISGKGFDLFFDAKAKAVDSAEEEDE